MNDVSAHGDDTELSDHSVETEGCYGAVTWTVCKELYSLLPRGKRDQLLDGTAVRVIDPYFTGLMERLLKQAGCEGTPTETLARDWSFETQLVSCVFGVVNWQISQGIWDALPEDQRVSLYEISGELIHDFFAENVFLPLMIYARNQLRG